jgi:hypothetical protein
VTGLEPRPGALLDGRGDDGHEPGERPVRSLGLGHELGLGAGAEAHPHSGPPDRGVEPFHLFGVERQPGVGEQQRAQPLPHIYRAHEVGRGHALPAVHQVALGQPVA